MSYLFRVLIFVCAALSLFSTSWAKRSDRFSGEFVEVCSSPCVYVCEHFLSDDECDHVIESVRGTLTRATVVDVDSSMSVVDSRRTSLGTFIPSTSQDKVIRKIQKRIAEATEIPEANGESMQILHYSEGAEYQPHFDYFDPATSGGAVHLNRGGQRVATFLIYLNTPEAGGETIFPRAQLKVIPRKGTAVLFYNVDSSGAPDPMSLHGGAPVVSGEKWLLTRWLREGAFF